MVKLVLFGGPLEVYKVVLGPHGGILSNLE